MTQTQVLKQYPTIGVCGLDCGLCPRYYTKGTSRCPGCAGPDFFEKHPSCSFITCCVKKKNHEVCGECPEFPCSKFKSEQVYQQVKESSSYPSYKNVLPNLNFIREKGMHRFMEQQKKRITLLETMIENFDDGRSRSFFCKTTGSLDIAHLQRSIDEAAKKVKSNKIKPDDVKAKAKILRQILTEASGTDVAP